MSAIEEFGGAVVRSAWENFWPFARSRLGVSSDALTCNMPGGDGRAVRHMRDGSSVPIIRYRYFPFCVRTIVWVDPGRRVGFIPHRCAAVRDSLTTHGWNVEVTTRSWRTAISDAREERRAHVDTGQVPTI